MIKDFDRIENGFIVNGDKKYGDEYDAQIEAKMEDLTGLGIVKDI